MPTLSQMQSLYKATRAAASRFHSYNFQQYFARRANERFAAPLATLGDESTIPESKTAMKLDDATLKLFFETATVDLEAIERSATLNSMYALDKLVVEGEGSRHGGN